MRLTILLALFMTVPLLARPRVLVVTATAGFRHESIEVAERVLGELAEERSVGAGAADGGDAAPRGSTLMKHWCRKRSRTRRSCRRHRSSEN